MKFEAFDTKNWGKWHKKDQGLWNSEVGPAVAWKAKTSDFVNTSPRQDGAASMRKSEVAMRIEAAWRREHGAWDSNAQGPDCYLAFNRFLKTVFYESVKAVGLCGYLQGLLQMIPALHRVSEDFSACALALRVTLNLSHDRWVSWKQSAFRLFQ